MDPEIKRLRYIREAFGEIPGVPGVRVERGSIPDREYELVVTPGDLARQGGKSIASHGWYAGVLASFLACCEIDGECLLRHRLLLRQDCLNARNGREEQRLGEPLLVRRMVRVAGATGYGRIVRADPMMAISMMLADADKAYDLIEGLQGWLLPGLQVHAEGYRLAGMPMIAACERQAFLSHCTGYGGVPEVLPLYFRYA